ncbi:MAG: hypothetical protein V7752_07880 [Halopseudomonas sp.]
MIEITPLTILLLVFAAGVVIFFVKGLVIVQQSEAMVIERLGRYSRTLDQGLHLPLSNYRWSAATGDAGVGADRSA